MKIIVCVIIYFITILVLNVMNNVLNDPYKNTRVPSLSQAHRGANMSLFISTCTNLKNKINLITNLKFV